MLMCVNCGKKATKGSMKFPFCKVCFKKKFNDKYEEYKKVLEGNL